MSETTRNIGRGFLAVAMVWVGYLVVAFTLASGFEQALVDAADELGVSDQRLPADVLARIYEAHTASSLAGSPLLVLAPAVLLAATLSVRRSWPSSLADWSVRTAGVSAAIWWFYLLIDLGLYGDPDNLPPLTRDLGVLAVPLVGSSSAFGVIAVISAAEAMRRTGWIRRTARAASVVGVVLLVLGVADMALSGFDRPLPPVALVPPAAILGVALLRSTRSASTPTAHLSNAASRRED